MARELGASRLEDDDPEISNADVPLHPPAMPPPISFQPGVTVTYRPEPAWKAGPPKVFDLFVAVMRGIDSIAKNDQNTQQRYFFRGVDATMNAVGPLVREHGLVVLPNDVTILADERYESKGRDGRPGSLMRSITVKVVWKISGPAGDSMYAQTLGEAADAGDKAVPKAMSVAFRELWLKGLVVPTGDKDVDQDPPAERAAPVNMSVATTLAQNFTTELQNAQNEDPGVREVWNRIQERYDAGALTYDQYVSLRDVASHRIAALQRASTGEYVQPQ